MDPKVGNRKCGLGLHEFEKVTSYKSLPFLVSKGSPIIFPNYFTNWIFSLELYHDNIFVAFEGCIFCYSSARTHYALAILCYIIMPFCTST